MGHEDCGKRIKQAMASLGMTQAELCKITGIPKSAISQYISGAFRPKQDRTFLIADALKVSPGWLMGFDVPANKPLNPPTITEDTVTYPVIGEVAAGYDKIAVEDWDGDTVEIPTEYLRGRNRDEFFVLRVKGDSMYPIYMDGDKVLILKQSTVNNSGDVGVVIYDDDCGTLKKVEFVKGEDWLELIPINPMYRPERIEGEKLEHCNVIGIPKLLIREIEQ